MKAYISDVADCRCVQFGDETRSSGGSSEQFVRSFVRSFVVRKEKKQDVGTCATSRAQG
jgi:hypothetical protein